MPNASSAPTCRVLVVDDCRDTIAALALLLRHWGHEVSTAADGRSALELARLFPPDVVFLDIAMPGMTGFELARGLRQNASLKALLVAISGYSSEEDRRLALEAGCDCYLVKPVEPELLQLLLDRESRQRMLSSLTASRMGPCHE